MELHRFDELNSNCLEISIFIYFHNEFSKKIVFKPPSPSFSVGISDCGHYNPNIEWGWGRRKGLGAWVINNILFVSCIMSMIAA